MQVPKVDFPNGTMARDSPLESTRNFDFGGGLEIRTSQTCEKWRQFRSDGIKKSAQFDLKNETHRNYLDTNLAT